MLYCPPLANHDIAFFAPNFAPVIQPLKSMSSSRIFHPPNLLLLKTPRNFNVHCRTTHHLRSPYRSLASHNHFPKFLSLPVSAAAPFSISGSNFIDRLLFGPDESSFRCWNFASGSSITDRRNGSVAVDEGTEVAVVLLGWLGAKPKHVNKYAQWYNAKGIHSVAFTSSVTDVLSLDLGKKLEERIDRLTHQLTSWLSNEGHRNRFLIFHTFSNTGWLTYGAILGHLKDRQDLLEKIKGCIVDSGGDPIIDPKVWAAGFTTALLKKSSSVTYPSSEKGGGTQFEIGKNRSNIEKKEPLLIETLLLFTFEKLFSYILNLPDVNRRLEKIICTLSENQPPCPQLYLYSTGDKVIPFKRVESFIEEQRRSGRRVLSFNFGSSPHVDHYRTSPDLYSSQLDNFLKECSVGVVKF